MRDLISKAFRSNIKATVALVGLIVIGFAVGSYILANQRLNPPSWIPVVGEDHFILKSEIESAQGVLPGQGQAVNISGVKVGDIASVELENGRALLTMRIEPRFANVYPNATVLLRPKTGLKDMVVELDPGSSSSGEKLDEGAKLANEDTIPDVNPEEFWATFDADTRDYLKLLLGDAGRALGKGGGRDLANTFRRLQPLSRDFAKANSLVAKRRTQLKRVMHNFSLLMAELGAHDRQLTRFVGANSEVFRRFANQNENLAETFALLPDALASSNQALVDLTTLGNSMRKTFSATLPMARALGPSLVQMRPAFRRTTPVLKNQIRPFTRDVQPIARQLVQPASDLKAATPDLMKFTEVFNALFNELAYDPPGKGKDGQGFLFYLPWANHNLNSMLSIQDGIGPLRRGLVLISCGQLQILESLAKAPPGQTEPRNPTLLTLIELLNAPERSSVCGGSS